MNDALGRNVPRGYEAAYIKRIPVADIVPGHAYVIQARNGLVGIAQWKTKYDTVEADAEGAERYEFPPLPNGQPGRIIYRRPYQSLGYVIRRVKFGDVYLFSEYDFDGKYFPTAIPLRDLGPAPIQSDYEALKGEAAEALLTWLHEQEQKVTPGEDPWAEYR